jgi:hypothetical protein
MNGYFQAYESLCLIADGVLFNRMLIPGHTGLHDGVLLNRMLIPGHTGCLINLAFTLTTHSQIKNAIHFKSGLYKAHPRAVDQPMLGHLNHTHSHYHILLIEVLLQSLAWALNSCINVKNLSTCRWGAGGRASNVNRNANERLLAVQFTFYLTLTHPNYSAKY